MKSAPLIILAVSLAVLFLLMQKDPILTATRINPDSGETFAMESLYLPKVSTQSLFNTIGATEYVLQSTAPFDPSKEDSLMTLRATVTSPFNEPAYLRAISIYKNGELEYSRKITLPTFGPGSSYVYDSEPLDLTGRDARRNTIRMDFLFESTSGQQTTQEFTYDYFSLTQCFKDDECSGETSVCDIDNVAGFSQGIYAYCVKPCVSNEFCDSDQLCRNGRCGY